LGQLGTAATNRLIVPAPGDYDDGEIGGMIGKGNRSTRRKPVPVPLCPPQTSHACPDANPGRRGGKPVNERHFEKNISNRPPQNFPVDGAAATTVQPIFSDPTY
jgi:hypothetical protein